MSKNLFFGNKRPKWPLAMYVGSGLCTWAKACVCRHIPAYAARVSEV